MGLNKPFVSPYPFSCPKCGKEVKEDEEIERNSEEQKERFIHILCEDCEKETRIRQSPIVFGFEVLC